MRHNNTITITETFSEVGTKTIDERNRLLIGDVIKKVFESVRRVQVMQGHDGDILLRPLVEIPAQEAWLYRNKKALQSVRKGLKQAKEGKLFDFDESRLAPEE